MQMNSLHETQLIPTQDEPRSLQTQCTLISWYTTHVLLSKVCRYAINDQDIFEGCDYSVVYNP